MNQPDSAAAAPPDTSSEVRRPGTLSDRVQSLRLADRPVGGSSKLPWVLCLILLASTVAFGVQSMRKSQAPSDAGDKGPPKSDGKTADSGDVVLQAKGYIIPAHPILVTPQVGGKVESLFIEEGMRVLEGQILAQIEVIEYEAKYKRARAKYESARLTWELARGSVPEEIKRAGYDLDESRAEHARGKDLLDRAERLDIGTQSREEMTKLRNDLAMIDARVKRRSRDVELAALSRLRVLASEAETDAAKAEMDEARWRLDSCTILAPVSGTILSKDAEQNNLLSPAAFKVEAKLCGMADLSDLEVVLDIQERDIDNVVVGQQCLVMPEAFARNKIFLSKHAQGYEGKVSRLMPTADRSKGAIPVRVKVQVAREEEGVYLKPDMGVIVSFKKAGG